MMFTVLFPSEGKLREIFLLLCFTKVVKIKAIASVKMYMYVQPLPSSCIHDLYVLYILLHVDNSV